MSPSPGIGSIAGLLVLTAVAILGLLVLSTAAAGGSDHVIVRTCLSATRYALRSFSN